MTNEKLFKHLQTQRVRAMLLQLKSLANGNKLRADKLERYVRCTVSQLRNISPVPKFNALSRTSTWEQT